MASRRAELGNGRARLRQDHESTGYAASKFAIIVFENNWLAMVLGSKCRHHDGLNKIIALGKINSKSAAQAEYEFLEYTGHDDLLNE